MAWLSGRDGRRAGSAAAPRLRGGLDCSAGYEFWLARQAFARNPAIKLYGLQWSAPSWVSGGHGGLWSTADVHYVVDWLRCARENGLTIGYVGGWNEHYQGTPVQQAWFVNLRRALDLAGFTGTQIVAADQTPQLTANGPAPVTLASGWVAAAHAYAMSLSTRGTTISASINDARVATVINGAYRDGPAGLASLGCYPVQYPSFGVG